MNEIKERDMLLAGVSPLKKTDEHAAEVTVHARVDVIGRNTSICGVQGSSDFSQVQRVVIKEVAADGDGADWCEDGMKNAGWHYPVRI